MPSPSRRHGKHDGPGPRQASARDGKSSDAMSLQAPPSYAVSDDEESLQPVPLSSPSRLHSFPASPAEDHNIQPPVFDQSVAYEPSRRLSSNTGYSPASPPALPPDLRAPSSTGDPYDAPLSGSPALREQLRRPSSSQQGNTRRHGRLSSGSNVSRQNISAQPVADRRPNYRALDTLCSSGVSVPGPYENVLVLGHDGGLDVFAISREKNALLASLTELNGVVTSAKILPSWQRFDEMRAVRPLIAVVIHGPAQLQEEDAHWNSRFPDEPLFQTTVNVYSLKTAELITTLYKSPLSADSDSCPGSPSNKIELDARGNFLTVTPVESGEIFVFSCRQEVVNGEKRAFRCIGKFWTTVQSYRPTPESRSSSFSEGAAPKEDSKALVRSPVYSLSPRWLAILPPSTLSIGSVQGVASVNPQAASPPGISSALPPHPPEPDATVDTEESESLINRMARGAAQELLKGAKWANLQGTQAWQRYWNGPSAPSNEDSPGGENAIDDRFPPTHADLQSGDESGPKPVSVLDLEALAAFDSSKTRDSFRPLVTFSISGGCSFLSFSPAGLALMTVSHRGDVQQIWSLIGLKPHDGATAGSSTARSWIGSRKALSPTVHELVRFKRLTDAKVVEVAWKEPLGGIVALITSRGTIHIFDLPKGALELSLPAKLKPKSRARSAPEAPSPRAGSIGSQDTSLPLTSPGAFTSTLRGMTRPWIDAVRERSSGPSNVLGSFGGWGLSAGHGIRSGKALAAEVGRSINQLAGEERARIKLSMGPSGMRRGCIRFLTGAERGQLAAISHTNIRFHSLSKPTKDQKTLRDIDVALPTNKPGQVMASPQARSGRWLDPPKAEGVWRLPSPSEDRGPLTASLHPLSYAEIETQSRFQPFHLSRSCTLYTYKDPDPWDSDYQQTVDGGATPWTFGGAIAVAKLDTGISLLAESHTVDEGTAGGMERIVVRSSRAPDAAPEPVPAGEATQAATDREEDFFERDCAVLDLAGGE